MADIERLAREALADVRATVAGYREVTLAAEISSARTALDAAGVDAELPGAVDEVPGERRELFGWVLREGVTNVVRHSDASGCGCRVSPTRVEIVDDGTAPARRPADGQRADRAAGTARRGRRPARRRARSTAAASACTPRCRRAMSTR